MPALTQIKDEMPNSLKTFIAYDIYFIKYTKSESIPELISQTANNENRINAVCWAFLLVWF